MKKTLLSILFSVMLILSAYLFCPVFAEDFTDVPDNAWYKQYVDYANKSGLMNGVDDGLFSPDGTFTTAQCITVAARLHADCHGKEIPAVGKEWYSPYVSYSVENSIITENQFDNYNENISRRDCAIILSKALPKEKLSAINDVKGIPDVAHDDDALDSILLLYNAGVLSGSDELGCYMPSSYIKRSEISAILTRLHDEDSRIKVDIPYVGHPRYLIDDHTVTGPLGLQSGWHYDNKYDLDNNTGARSFFISADIGQKTNINRPVNTITKGKARFDANVCYAYAVTGAYVALEDSNRKNVVKVVSENDKFTIISDKAKIETDIYVCENDSKTHTIIFETDFETGLCVVTIDYTTFDSIPFDTERGISRLSIGHDGSGCGDLRLDGARCVADYSLCESFLANDLCEGKPLYGSWETQGNVVLSKILSERGADVFSAKMEGESSAQYKFDKLGASFCAEAYVLLPDANANLVFALSDKFSIYTSNGYFYCGDKQLRNVVQNVWTSIRVEADCHDGSAFIRINGKDCGTVPFTDSFIDGICFENSRGTVWFDDVKAYNLFDYTDYPTPPVSVNDDDYNIGVNVCNLWRNGHCTEGYDAAAPFYELYPLIGLADEGLPELADWEIKQMAEHGIDFQHICWYSPQADTKAPVKGISVPQIALDEGYMNAKYSDSVKFCIMWENANGAVVDTEHFKEFIWPYFKEHYFSDSRYYTIDNKPLMTIWSYSKFISCLGGVEGAKQVMDFMREDIKTLGYDGLYIWFGGGTSLAKAKTVDADAVYPYNYGRPGESAEHQITTMNNMLKDRETLYYVPGVSVGFNAVGRHDERSGMISDKEHELVCDYIKNTYLPTVPEDHPFHNTLIVSTWNEYTEGTYVAPNNLCGFDYLDNIRLSFTGAPTEHTDIFPSEKVKDRLRNIYPDGHSPIRRYHLENTEKEDLALALEQRGVTVKKWDFSNLQDRLAWKLSHGIDEFTYYDDRIKGKTNQIDPGIRLSEQIDLDVAKTGAYYLYIKMRTNVNTTPELFFYGKSEPKFTAEKSVRWSIEASDGYQECYVYLGSNKLWRKDIIDLRIDPINGPGEFEIKEIRLMALPDDENAFFVSFDGRRIDFDFEPEYSQELDDYLVTANPRLGFFSMSHCYYEYNIDKTQLTVESLHHSLILTVGSDKAICDGVEVDLGYTLYLRDGLPVVPIKKYMALLGFEGKAVKGGIDYDTSSDDIKAALAEVREGNWEFNTFGSMSGWNTQNSKGSFVEGSFALETTGKDPAILIKNLSIDLDENNYTKVTVGLKFDCDDKTAISQLFFVAGNVTSLCEEASEKYYHTTSSSGENFVEVTFDMTENIHWIGELSVLRFDPFSGNGTFEVDYIRLS